MQIDARSTRRARRSLIVVLRSIPLAPFTVVNLAAGSIGVPLRVCV